MTSYLLPHVRQSKATTLNRDSHVVVHIVLLLDPIPAWENINVYVVEIAKTLVLGNWKMVYRLGGGQHCLCHA